MKKSTPSAAVVPAAIVEDAWQDVSASFERFCLTAGLATLSTMMEEDAVHLCGPRYGRADSKTGHRWGTTKGKVGFHGGKVELHGHYPASSLLWGGPRLTGPSVLSASGRVSAPATAASWSCRAGNLPCPRTCWAGGR